MAAMCLRVVRRAFPSHGFQVAPLCASLTSFSVAAGMSVPIASFQSSTVLPSAHTRSMATGASEAASSLFLSPAGSARSLSLSDLQPARGSNRRRRRKGRGEGSGMGKYATRGMKGTKSRAGGAVQLGFEGGQTPLWRRTPKIGYMPAMLDTPFEAINLDKLQHAIDTGRIDASRKITMKSLLDAGVVSHIDYGIKLLAGGADRFVAKVDIEVSQASGSAIAAVEAAGGKIASVYYSPLALRSLLSPHKFDLPIKSPRPPPKLLDYYTSFTNRGYLSSELQLKELKERVEAGVPLEQAAALMPIYAGGPVQSAAKGGLLPAGAHVAPLTATHGIAIPPPTPAAVAAGAGAGSESTATATA